MWPAAFLHSELKELFANAPPLPIDTLEDDVKDGNQKEVTGECPICFMDFEEDEDIVWCKAACGKYVDLSFSLTNNSSTDFTPQQHSPRLL